ncbi:hypothetical protein T484DRAFT_1790001, partial [Baffinella frigidus]
MVRLGKTTLAVLKDEARRDAVIELLAAGDVSSNGDKSAGQGRISEAGPAGAAQNKVSSVEALQTGLKKRFDSVYDAYVFFDINGDWNLTIVELRLMLKSLAVEVLLPVPDIDYAFRALDGDSKSTQDGAIDPKEFTSILAWHKLKPNLTHAMSEARARRKQIMAKAMALTQAELAIASAQRKADHQAHEKQAERRKYEQAAALKAVQ